jgi:hypothetical protein
MLWERRLAPVEANVSDDFDIEEEWEEARRSAREDGPKPVVKGPGLRKTETSKPYLSPYLLLQTGFLVGPLATLVGAVLVAPRRVTWRRGVVLVAIAAAGWCAVQGATAVFGAQLGDTSLRMMRAGLNFLVGLAAMIFWRSEDRSVFVHDRHVWIRTLGAAALMLAVSLALSTKVLITLGW